MWCWGHLFLFCQRWHIAHDVLVKVTLGPKHASLCRVIRHPQHLGTLSCIKLASDLVRVLAWDYKAVWSALGFEHAFALLYLSTIAWRASIIFCVLITHIESSKRIFHLL